MKNLKLAALLDWAVSNNVDLDKADNLEMDGSLKGVILHVHDYGYCDKNLKTLIRSLKRAFGRLTIEGDPPYGVLVPLVPVELDEGGNPFNVICRIYGQTKCEKVGTRVETRKVRKPVGGYVEVEEEVEVPIWDCK